MFKRKRFLPILLLTAAAAYLITLVTDTALADDLHALLVQNRVTEFTALDASCAMINEGESIVDDDAGVVYSRGTIYKGAIVAANPMLQGTSYIVVDTVEDQESGETDVWVTTFLYPDLVDGAFIFPGKGTITADGPNVSHRGHGIGELAGLRIRVTAHAPTEDPGDLPCDPLFPPVQLDGVIIELPSS